MRRWRALGILACSLSFACSGGEGEELDTAGARSITVARRYCGGRAFTCYGEQEFIVDLEASTLETSRCVGDGGTSEPTTRSLSTEEVQAVRDALARVRVASEKHCCLDGPMHSLTVTTRAGKAAYSPDAMCNHDLYTKVVGGWDGLWATVSGL